MRILIRMISIATTFFWIFLIAFFITAVYSIKDVHFNIGKTQMSTTSDNKIVFSLPISIENRGFYNIDYFSIKTTISDKNGSIITSGSTLMPVIRKNDEIVINHNMTINATDLLHKNESYLFNDSELIIYEVLGLRIAEMIPIQASANFSIPWGAPFYNFTLGQTRSNAYNDTHLRVTIPISFENHAFFDFNGTIQIRMYNSTDRLAGEGQTNIVVWQNSPYNGSIEFLAKMTDFTDSGCFEVNLQTSLFEYEGMMIPYG